MKSKTPIFDFLNKYASLDTSRFHMPGHKGINTLGIEQYDITEIDGADSLFEAQGIIAESQENLTRIFETRASFYSTEGSSLCIRAMLYLALLHSKEKGKKILAARNVHKSFVTSLALCDVGAEWIQGEDLYSCKVDANYLEKALCTGEYFAVYITSPDYLGNMQDIASLSKACHKYNVPLLVDNAHGAYLKFVGLHPLDLGADMCCDSAHKTLCCLTGAAYLHISKNALFDYEKDSKRALSMFASTSPSYLIMASLDLANRRMMSPGFLNSIKITAKIVSEIRACAEKRGIETVGTEPLKLTLKPKSFGYTASQLYELMKNEGIFCEFCDKDNLVLMFSVNNRQEDFSKLFLFLKGLKRKPAICEMPPVPVRLEKKLSVREAGFSPCEKISVDLAENRVLADTSVSCPPAIPIAVCGELLNKQSIECFKYYGIQKVSVVKE